MSRSACPGFAAALVALLTLVVTGTADERLGPAPDEVVEECIYDVRFRHSSDNILQDAGVTRRLMLRRGDRYVTIEQSRLKFQIAGRTVEERQESVQVEDLKGKVVEFAYTDDSRTIIGKATRDNRVLVRRTKDGETVEREVEFPRDMLTDNANVRKLLATPLKVGRPKQVLKELSIYRSLEGPRILEFLYLGSHRLEFQGRPVETFLFQQDERDPPPDRDEWLVKFWVDRAGRLYRFEMKTKGEEPTAYFEFIRVK
jgi:hypothetical protein